MGLAVGTECPIPSVHKGEGVPASAVFSVPTPGIELEPRRRLVPPALRIYRRKSRRSRGTLLPYSLFAWFGIGWSASMLCYLSA